VTTVDKDSVRTELQLEPEQSAVVVRVPVAIESARPVNVRLTQYDESGIGIAMNGAGEAQITVTDGEFRVGEGERFVVQGPPVPPEARPYTDTALEIRADAAGLTLPMVWDGVLKFRIVPVGEN
jgi:hypothetical protein